MKKNIYNKLINNNIEQHIIGNMKKIVLFPSKIIYHKNLKIFTGRKRTT